MATLIQTKIGENRGKPRLWVEGQRLAREGILPGMRFRMAIEDGYLTLHALSATQVGHSVRISERKASKRPLFEITDKVLDTLFGIDTRVVIKFSPGKMRITRHHLDVKRNARESAFQERLREGKPLRVASLYHGGGVVDSAVHEGLADAGIMSYCKLACEIEAAYIESSLTNNAHLFREDSLILHSPIEQLDFTLPSNVSADLILAGVPCVGASRSGRAKNKLDHAEQHSSAGAQFFAFLRMIERVNPAMAILENVSEYQNTAGYAVVLSVLETLGYRVQERILNGLEFGALEDRNRLVMVAVSEGLVGFDMAQIVPVCAKPPAVADILDRAEDVADLWRDFKGLREKEERDIAAGKGFRRQIVTPEAESVGTIGRGYMKGRSTEPQLQHPTDPKLTRLFSVREHARIKRIPERIVAGLSATVAHEIMGQSVIYSVFRAVGRALGYWTASMAPSPWKSKAA